MAIINCAGCGKRISSISPICPHCGFQRGDASDEQLEEFTRRKLRDRIYHLKMISYVVMTVVVAAFGWYWLDTGGFQHRSGMGPLILFGIGAAVWFWMELH